MNLVPYTKPAISVDDQISILKGRGMIIQDDSKVKFYLEQIGYYRLSGYSFPFKVGGSGADKDNYKAGTDFDEILDRYIFDRKLRLLVMDAVERIEIAIRAALSNSLATRHGPHWYMDADKFDTKTLDRKNQPIFSHDQYLNKIRNDIGHSDKSRMDVHIQHYYETYNNPTMPPSWMVFESVSFGVVSRTLRHLVYTEHKPICKSFELNHGILSSWIHSISYVRNLCAHHSRLWNKVFTIKPLLAREYKKDIKSNKKLYAQLAVMQILLSKIAPENNWAYKLSDLLTEHSNIPEAEMGFPVDWQESQIWNF